MFRPLEGETGRDSSNSMTGGIIGLLIIGVLAVWLILMYNGLIRSRNRVDEAWSDIDVQLKRRYDLIPNLVNTVKGYAQHERELFEKVTEARSRAMQAGTTHDKAEAENMLSDTLKSLFAVAENYPDLKANQNFLELQRELSDTENKIQAARRFYNGNVLDFNTKIQVFPTNIFAGMFNFAKREFFEANETERENVKVEF
jgi:LemA protein